MNRKQYVLLAALLVVSSTGKSQEPRSGTKEIAVKAQIENIASAEKQRVIAPGAQVEKLADGFTWAEGPAEDSVGNIFFTDNRRRKIYRWSPDGKVTTFIENSRGDNGLYFDNNGVLLSCTGGTKELVSISPDGTYTVIVDSHNGTPLNGPNDLWVDSKGGVYFTDPFWGRQEGRDNVYYLSPDRTKLTLVNNDMFNPNGIIGSPDGKWLYVSNYVENKTYVFTINEDGTLSDKRLFAPEGDDGMTVDTDGNIYLTGKAITVYNPDGNKIDTIEVPETPANVLFCGKDKQTLFITARTSIYAIRMRTKGL